MPTPWTFPTIISQYSEPGAESADIQWDSSNYFNELKEFDGRSLVTTGNLVHIARSPHADIRNKTYFLKCTGYNFLSLPTQLSGIEVKVNANRYGRAQDDTMNLTLNGNLIGENASTPLIDPIKIYGGPTDLWGATLTKDNIIDPTFGFVLRFQAHRHWPHRDPVLVDAVQIRIW